MTATLSSLQASRPVALPAAEVHATLQAEGPALAELATAHAILVVEPLRAPAGLGHPPAPRITTTVPDHGPAAIRVTWGHEQRDRWPPRANFATRPTSSWWRTGEEESGWPVATLDVLVEPRPRGAQVSVVSSRPPGVDLSTNRVDKHVRDRVARAAIERFLDALVELLEAAVAVPAHEI